MTAARARLERPWLLFLLAAALSAVTIWWEIGPHDEGLMLQAAHRIAEGQLPYRDFWWNYAPGQPLLLAPFDALLGSALVPWRILRVLADATVALLAFTLVRREIAVLAPAAAAASAGAPPRASAWRTWLPLLTWLAVAGAMAFPTGPGPNPVALVLALSALLVAPRRVVLAGVLAGLAAVFRLEIGGAAALGVVLLGAPRALPVAMAVAAAGWAPFFLAAPSETLDQTLGFLGIQDLQRRPFPLDPSGTGGSPVKLLELWMPAILVLAAAAWAVAAALRRPPLRAVALAPLALVGLAYLLGRTDEFHLVPLAVALPLLLAVAAAREPHPAVALALAALIGVIALHGLERKAAQLTGRPELARVPGPAGDGIRTTAAEAADLARVLAAVRGDRTLLVLPPRTDRVTVGNPLLYRLTGTENPTRYDVMQPGVVTEPDVQREMVADLDRARPRHVVRWVDPRTAPEDNPSGRLRGARILDAYVARHYATPRRFGTFVVLTRR